MEEALTAVLLANAGLTAIVQDRIDWVRRPQGKPLPYLVLHKIDDLPGYTLNSEDGLASARIQFDCWGSTYLQAKDLARAVQAAVSGINTDQDGIKLRGGFKEGERDNHERGAGSADLYNVSLDFIFWHSRG